jgi:hypothetical protein
MLCLQVGEKALAGQLLLDGEPLDPPPPLSIVLHKPTGYVVTSPDDENVTDPKTYDLLPYRWVTHEEGTASCCVTCRAVVHMWCATYVTYICGAWLACGTSAVLGI